MFTERQPQLYHFLTVCHLAICCSQFSFPFVESIETHLSFHLLWAGVVLWKPEGLKQFTTTEDLCFTRRQAHSTSQGKTKNCQQSPHLPARAWLWNTLGHWQPCLTPAPVWTWGSWGIPVVVFSCVPGILQEASQWMRLPQTNSTTSWALP